VGGGRRDPSQALVTLAAHDRVDQLVAIVDVNGLGQSGSTMLEWGVDAYRRLAVREIPRSGPTRKLLERYGIGRVAIVEAARRMVAGAAPDRAAAA